MGAVSDALGARRDTTAAVGGSRRSSQTERIMANASSSMEWLDPDMDATSGTVALAIVGLFPAVAVLVAVFAQSKTIAAFAQLGGLRERTHARTQWTADHPSPLTRLGRALGREARGGTGRVRSAAGHARVCHLCGREGDPSLA